MHIDTFEGEIDPKILERGRQYYKNGAVGELLSEEEGLYTADVEGSEYYEVEARLDDSGEIVDITCDCPYDWGDVCKHGVAVLLAVRKKRSMEAVQPKKALKKKPDLRAVLLSQSREALAEELLSLAGKDRTLRQSLLLRFGDREDEIEGSRKLVRQSMKRRNFWEYGTADEALEGSWTVLRRAEDCAEADPARAVRLSLVVLPEAVELTGYCDDSNGEVGEVFSACIEIIRTAVASVPEKPAAPGRADLFRVILEESKNPAYDGWEEQRLELLESLVPLCNDAALRETLSLVLAEERQRPRRGYGRYYEEALAKLQLELLTRWGEAGQAEGFIKENLAFPDFRRKAITDAMERKDYPAAAHLAEKGIAQDTAYPGLVHQWRTALYHACEATGDKARVLELAEFFVLHEREGFSYYAALKSGFSPETWPDKLKALLSLFEKQPYPGRVYVDLLLEEEDFDRLLAFIQKHPGELVGLARHFPVAYGETLSELYRQLILKRAVTASDRGQYKAVCEILRSFGNELGYDRMRGAVKEIQAAYPRRPAFQDELRKIR